MTQPARNEALLSERLAPVRSTLRVVRRAELDVRDQVDALEQHETSEIARRLVSSSLLPLEMTMFAACLSELGARRGATHLGDLDPYRDEVLEELRRRMRVPDLASVLEEHMPALRSAGTAQSWEELDPRLQPVPSFAAVARQAQALVAACPIGVIERAARLAMLPEQAHRCRVAYDGLRAFLRRADPGPIDEVGRAYASGALSIAQVAAILAISVPDAVAELEERGHYRSPEVLALHAEHEDAIYRALREDRERRSGEPELSEEHVLRDVIASERIEGVDARPWLRPRHE